MKCIFLRYSRLQRGYRFYSPDAHQYFVSVDVTFFGTFFYFLYPCLPVPRSYLYLSYFPFRLYHLSPQLRRLICCRFILVVLVSTPGLPMTHLLWHPPTRRPSCRLPLILPSPFRKVLCILLAHGTWSPYLLASLLLVAVGFILLRLVWMVGWIVLRLVWLPRSILRL